MLSSDEIRRAVRAALAEDIGSGDVTTLATVPEETTVTALMVAREPLVVAGLDLAEAAFLELCPLAEPPARRLGRRARAGGIHAVENSPRPGARRSFPPNGWR